MSDETLTLTAYFAERERTADRFLAEAMLELFDDREIAASVLLRGIAGFGVSNVALSDRTLTMAENAPVTLYAIDRPDRILALTDSVAAMTRRGVITLRRDLGLPDALPEQATNVRLWVYLGRKHRIAGRPGYMAVCDVLHHRGFAAAEVLLGVDGTVGGQRRRAQFFGSNSEVPLLISGVGTLAQTAEAVEELRGILPDPLFTVDQVLVCKNRGQRLADPGDLANVSQFQKLTVRTSEDNRIDGQPVHRALIERLKDSEHASGATVLRGMWGYLGTSRPHGDRFLQVARHVPVSTLIVDTSANIAASYAIVDELTENDGLVTCEVVSAMLGLHDGQRVGSLQLG
ncbi:MAG: DUF190 domain-containing protein [Actinomycetia bacterium]|nr:DUF190 domain-containing protein [Actinomycetes bacterium]MCH9701504.1 DUF190 domain-containing protein [Actinomycetes bacterium]MCH9760756.1 DUF190 domain-containing protein [Actinomycetes bacterium]